MGQPSSEFRPSLESYRGPLDLLLYLIKKDEIDIFDIPIARIVEQYQLYLEVLTQIDPNACGEFLVVAANLMEIKSKLLLPREVLSEDEELEDPRIELVRQLLEYKKYKERAMLLDRRIQERSRRYERPTAIFDGDVEVSGPVYLGNVSVWDLLTAFHKIQIALGQREPHRVILKDRPIEEYIASIESILSRAPSRTAKFDDLFVDVRTREDAIGLLLAVLELAKEHRLSFHQEELFGPIEVRLHEPEEVNRILAAALMEEEARVDPAEQLLLGGEGSQAAAEPIADGPSNPDGHQKEQPADGSSEPADGSS